MLDSHVDLEPKTISENAVVTPSTESLLSNKQIPIITTTTVDTDNVPMANSAYCFLSDSKFHCVPIDLVNSLTDKYFDNTNTLLDVSEFTPDKLYLRNKNLLYSLNNPSFSDVEDSNNANSSFQSASSLSQGISQSNSADKLGSSSDDESSVVSPAIYFPRFIVNLAENLANDFVQLRDLLCKVFNWSHPGEIQVKQLTGGITNMLLAINYNTENYLVRVYGHGTNLIIDRHREFISHLTLNSLNLAPPVHARFKNGVIYGFLPGTSLKPKDLRNPNVYPLVAQLLGVWHNQIDIKVIEGGIEKLRDFSLSIKKKKSSKSKFKKKFIGNIWELFEQWISIVPVNSKLIDSFKLHLPDTDVTESNIIQVLLAEYEWFKTTVETVNSPTVSGHCDLLSGNVIIPENYDLSVPLTKLPQPENNPIKFIDYEYMLPSPRAFDIANHFAEWQGFDCDKSAIPEPTPSNPVMVNFVKAYLNNENASEQEVNNLIEEIAMYHGLPGFFWFLWAMIQSELSNIDFDYANYAIKRLDEYWDWKSNYVLKQSS
jgi:ethanolamine kinase